MEWSVDCPATARSSLAKRRRVFSPTTGRARLALLKGGEAKALEVLDNPDPGILVFFRRQNLEIGRGTPAYRAAAMAEEEAYALVHRLHDGLRALGSEGRVIASGLFAGTGLRQAIPAELWALAKVGFGAGAVASNGFVYHNVTVEPWQRLSMSKTWLRQ